MVERSYGPGPDPAWPRQWLVPWGAIWVGVLAALTVGLVIGLIGYAVGAHEMTTRIARWSTVRRISIGFSIVGAFFAFVAGGWAAARIAGVRRSEPSMIIGAIVWLTAVPLLLVLAALGATAHYGGWYAGLAGTPIWATVAAPPVDPALAAAVRNTAVASVVALLLGLVGGVLGGWMASGEPMTFAYYRRRDHERPRMVA